MEPRDVILDSIDRQIKFRNFVDLPFVSYGQYIRSTEEVSDALVYVGYSASGVAKADERWIIRRITTTGTVIDFEYATNVAWDDRLTATYN